MFKIVMKLRKLKHALNDLLHKKYSRISERVRISQKKLFEVQENLQDDLTNDALIDNEKQLIEKYIKLKKA